MIASLKMLEGTYPSNKHIIHELCKVVTSEVKDVEL